MKKFDKHSGFFLEKKETFLYNNGRMKSREDLADEVFEKVNEAYRDLFGKDEIVL